VAQAGLDEVAIWDRALDDATIATVYQLGQAGKPLWDADRPAADASGPKPQRIELPKSLLAGERLQVERPTSTRETASLNGRWQLWPSAQPVEQLPDQGWGRTQVPGYWTTAGQTQGPDDRPVRGRWGKQPVAELPSVYHLRTFKTESVWSQKAVFLQLDGVDGLGEVYWNGQLLGRLPAWESEAYDVGPLVAEGQSNTLVVAVHRAGDPAQAGIYGNVSLRVLPSSFIQDVVVEPQVAAGKIRFSCDLWHAAAPTDARLEFEVTADSAAAPGKTFVHTCRLKPADRSRRELSTQMQRVETTFDWSDAHLWTYDDPFLYRVQARLKVGDQFRLPRDDRAR